jgi:hypothetical protein
MKKCLRPSRSREASVVLVNGTRVRMCEFSQKTTKLEMCNQLAVYISVRFIPAIVRVSFVFGTFCFAIIFVQFRRLHERIFKIYFHFAVSVFTAPSRNVRFVKIRENKLFMHASPPIARETRNSKTFFCSNSTCVHVRPSLIFHTNSIFLTFTQCVCVSLSLSLF